MDTSNFDNGSSASEHLFRVHDIFKNRHYCNCRCFSPDGNFPALNNDLIFKIKKGPQTQPFFVSVFKLLACDFVFTEEEVNFDLSVFKAV